MTTFFNINVGIFIVSNVGSFVPYPTKTTSASKSPLAHRERIKLKTDNPVSSALLGASLEGAISVKKFSPLHPRTSVEFRKVEMRRCSCLFEPIR